MTAHDAVDWSKAECVGMNPELFFPEKDWLLDPSVVDACERCVIRTECLTWAITTGQDFGYWGGLSEEKRAYVNRTRSRVRCPDCRSDHVTALGSCEVCRACGLSWPV